jgi:signal transduction histidine kinase/CheY-like chemotaxis protein
MRGVPLRRRLFLLVAVGIIPLAVMSGIGLYLLARQQRIQAWQVGLEFARALGTAVEAELRSSASVLTSLSTSLALDAGDVAGFRERAGRVVSTQPHWAAITLSDLAGKALVDTRVPHGTAPPPSIVEKSFEAVVKTRRPAVGNLMGTPPGAMTFPVRIPVFRKGELGYVLTALVKPEGIRDVVNRQNLPDDWIISIFDANGRRVARSRAHEENLGGPASPSLQALMATGGQQGIGQTVTLEGEPIYTTWVRLQDSGWSAVPGVPAALVEAAARRSLFAYGGGVLLSIALGMLGAVWVARSINRPIGTLRASAQALGRGEPLPASATPILEIRDVADALRTAAAERTRDEAERERLLRSEQDARAAAEAANRAKDQFLAVLSHELRTPLNAVYGWARMLIDGQVPAHSVDKALEAIVRNANAQVQLIDDLLDVSRIITGKMRLDVRSVDLPAVIEAALDAVRPAATAKSIRLESVLDPKAGPITGDPARLQQVVWNLLMNAVKFTPRNGKVQIHLQRVNSHVEVVVSDTGEGIPPHLLSSIFDRFQQADSSTTRAHTGLGLGLALVKHLAELHGGNVVARSAGEGKGATFVVSLPLTIAALPAAASGSHPTATTVEVLMPQGLRLDGVRVLVVDDAAEAQALASAMLTSAGAVVRTCASAPEAFDILREWRPDVLVSDIEMPGEDGYALIRKVRALPASEGGRTPAVALTAYGRTQDRMLSLNAGYSMHVPKPVDPGEFITIVASLAGRRMEEGVP